MYIENLKNLVIKFENLNKSLKNEIQKLIKN